MPTPSVSRPHLLATADVLRHLRVRHDTGLSTNEVNKRLQDQGPNRLPSAEKENIFQIFIDRLKDPLVIVLLASGAISLLLKEVGDAIIISVAIFLDAGLSFFQVYKASKKLKLIQQSISLKSYVRRHSITKLIPAEDLVTGDIIEIRAGNNIPADARLLSVNGLRTHEAALTGESSDVHKQSTRLTSRTPLANQSNMIFMGTVVVSGSAEAVVVATGTRTEYGKIARLLVSQPKTVTPLRRKLQKTSLQIGWLILAAIALLAAINIFQGQNLIETLRTSVTLLVSAIPEDLTVILTVALTVGVVRILRQGGVVKQLASAETLGAATVICVDKTGTLTEGNMSAQTLDLLQGTIINQDQPPRHHWPTQALIALAITPDAHRVQPDQAVYIGSETERTALAFAEKFGLNQISLRQQWRTRDRLNFDARWKYRAALCDHPRQSTQTLFVIGAPDVLLEKSSSCLDESSEVTKITSSTRKNLQQKINQLANDGHRLLAVAIRPSIKLNSVTHDDIVSLTFLGVLLINDPVRSEVAAAIKLTHSAGVAVKIITGDATPTARAIASQVGLSVSSDTILEGLAIEEMSDKDLQLEVKHINLFTRVNPLDKQRIVQALQKNGEVVAMTGDGVNDAVALKTADIGVAMGSGKDITKDASDLVLLQDSFAVITASIKEGRVLRDNLRKVISFLLATNFSEVCLFFVSVIAGLPLPLLPAQILWINIVTDGTSDLALAFEPAERNVMNRRPENPDAPLLGKNYLLQIVIAGATLTIIAIGLYIYLAKTGSSNIPYLRTMIFTFISIASLLSVWSWRSAYDNILKRGIWQNRWIILSAAFSLFLQLLAIYTPFLQSFLQTVPLNLNDWLIIIGLSLIALVIIDSRKIFLRPETNLHANQQTT